MQKRDKAPDVEPSVGIFWLYSGKVIIDSTRLSEAEVYGDALTHPTSHIDYWEVLQRTGAVPLDAEYEEFPRGRVVYDKRNGEFRLFADRCILDLENVVRQIAAALHLPMDKTSVGRDDHYRCTTCLNRRGQRGRR